MAMKRIEVHGPMGNRVYAVNEAGEGLFIRGEHGPAYSQMLGTGQFSARSAEDLESTLRSRGTIRTDDTVILISGW